MTTPKTVSFLEACRLIQSADRILVADRLFEIHTLPEDRHHALVLETHASESGPPAKMRTWFVEVGNEAVEVRNMALHMREEHGEAAVLIPVNFTDPGGVTARCVAETAAAIMDALHSEVTPQQDGSDGAYAELYDVATRLGLGFPGIWGWVATLADASRKRMEGLWYSGEADFLDCTQAVAQVFHNYITFPPNLKGSQNPLSLTKAEALWEEAVIAVEEHRRACSKWNEDEDFRRMLEELRNAVRNDAGFEVGVFNRVSDEVIEYTNYGGTPMIIKKWGSVWRVGSDQGTDSPRPVGAFKIAGIPIHRA